MEFRVGSTWDRSFQRKCTQAIAAHTDALVAGVPKDFAQYEYLRGQIDGIQFAITTLNELRERFEEDGGFGDDDAGG